MIIIYLKHCILVGILATGCACALAQPILTATTNNPHPGERFYSHDCDTTGITVGPSGAGVTWNYSSLSVVSEDSEFYQACSTSPYCDSFSGSTLSVFDGFGYEYYTTDAGKFAYSGSWNPFGYDIFFTDPQDLVSYPMTYLNNVVDTYSYYAGVDTFYAFGTDSLIADGYGTLITPAGSAPNALRVHVIEHEWDSSVYDGITYIDTLRSESYIWFVPGFHNPVLLMSVDTSDGTPYLSDVTYFSQMLSLKTAVVQESSPISIYPNPVRDEVHVLFSLHGAETATISVSDVAGRAVGNLQTEQLSSGRHDVVYNVSSLAPGVYLIYVQAGDETIVQKLVKIE